MNESNPPSAGAIVVLACAGFASMASLRACDAMLPELAQVFDASTARVAQVITAFAVAYGLLQLFYGPLGDRYGKYRVIAWATLACAVGSIGAALATSLPWLVFFRALTGATAAGIIPLSMAWIGDTIPYERRQATLARMLSGTVFGVVSGQLLGGFLTDTVGWRWTFVCLAGIYVAAGSLLHVELRRNRAAHADASAANSSERSYWSRLGSVLGSAWARTLLIVVFLEGTAVFGPLAFVPTYLHERFGLSLAAAGALSATFGVGGLAYILAAKRLVAGLGERGLALSGGGCMALAFVGIAAAPDWQWILPATFLAGGGYYMLHNTLQTNATQMAPSARGTAVALFAACLFMGQSVGVAVSAVAVARVGTIWVFALAALALLALGIGFARALERRDPSARASAEAPAASGTCERDDS